MAKHPPILVGIDFSPGAARAALWAKSLAQALEAPLLVIHVTDQVSADWTPDGLRWMDQVGLDPEALVIRRGVPWLELSRFSSEIEASILVVGSHGQSGYQPVTPGSVTGLLLSRSQQPVLVVPGALNERTAKLGATERE